MDKLSLPIIADILDVISAVFKLFTALGLAVVIVAVRSSPYINISKFAMGISLDITTILIIIAVTMAILGILAIIGGIYALQRKKWGLALTGSIAALFPVVGLLGIAAIILTLLSRDEFK